MKKTILLLTVCAFAVGCASVDKLFPSHVEPIRQADGSPLTKPVVLPDGSVTNVPQFATVLEPSPVLDTTAATLKAIPLPYAGTAGFALAFLAQAYVSLRNKKALTAVVTGIDAARSWLAQTAEGRKTDEKIKDFLIEHQEAAGVLKRVGNIVADHTGDTVKPLSSYQPI